MIQLPPLDYRIPKWNEHELADRNCPICASAAYTDCFIRPDNLRVRYCNHCNTYFISPGPTEEQLSSFYAHYDEHHGRASGTPIHELITRYQQADPLSDNRIRELHSLVTLKGARVLDVGFGRAEFLFFLKQLGAIPHGADPDIQSITIAKTLGIDHVYHGMIDQVPADLRFDIIVLNDLVEHPLHPMALLQTGHRLLNPRGLLLIWTPNGNAVNRDTNKTTFRVDLEHMQYLTTDTCQFIAAALQMRIVHLETLGFPALQGIDQPVVKNPGGVSSIKRAIKSIPGFSTINKLRRALKQTSNHQEERMGDYHLFCILQQQDG